jgi:uncharacterized membrane protein YeaQ/YmgE (transglycosylase-associated protein family)
LDYLGDDPVVEALVGWLASIVIQTDPQQGTLMSIIIGSVGAFLGGLLFNFLLGSPSNINNNDFSLGCLLVSFIGAVVLLGIVNLARRGYRTIPVAESNTAPLIDIPGALCCWCLWLNRAGISSGRSEHHPCHSMGCSSPVRFVIVS